ncbi:DUF5134 domain-containing protein [Nocardia sp. NPDC005366]|uniref:DUF5134 domain-containing protein n=1 Tax=Nocardia sp. NPDC005366 TaxID=3156878 RepID=UPI0033BAAAC8
MDHANPAPRATAALITLCLVAAVVACARLIRSGAVPTGPGRFGRGADLVHAVMLVAMAAMWSAAGAALPITFWRSLFGMVAAVSLLWLIVGSARADSANRGEQAGAALYHCVAAIAMIYATLTSHGSHSEHDQHATTHVTSPPIPAIGWFLVTLFVLDALVVTVAAIRAPRQFGNTRPATIAAVFPHATMDFTMAVMLVLALRSPG